MLDVINASWNPDGTSKNMVDSVGVMWYVGIESLNYVKNYAEATSQWQGFPIKVSFIMFIGQQKLNFRPVLKPFFSGILK